MTRKALSLGITGVVAAISMAMAPAAADAQYYGGGPGYHGRPNPGWHELASDLRIGAACPKLRTYWDFHDCQYNKSRFTCSRLDHIAACPLPARWLRNGRLNRAGWRVGWNFWRRERQSRAIGRWASRYRAAYDVRRAAERSYGRYGPGCTSADRCGVHCRWPQ